MIDDLTVVVPNYNKAEYLSRCLESIANQTEPPKSIIIVDDASTDNSKTVIERLLLKYPNIYVHYKMNNTGVSNTRNIGISLADTDYITFIDADDYYMNKNKLALEMALQREKGGDIIAYSVTKFTGKDGKTITKNKPKSYYLSGNVYDDLLITRKWDSVMRDYVLRTETLKKAGGYNEKRSLFEDYELLLILARDHEFYCTGEYGTLYTEGTGLSAADKEEQLNMQNEIINYELERLDENHRKKIIRNRKLLLMKRRIRSFI